MRLFAPLVAIVAVACSTPAVADSLSSVQRVCDEETFDYRGKVLEMLDAAFNDDYRSFRTVNGTYPGVPIPEIHTLGDGSRFWGSALAVFSGSQGRDEHRPEIVQWIPLYQAKSAGLESYRLFFAEIERSIWNDFTEEFQARKSTWLLHFYDGCALKLIQETELPLWIGEEANG